MDAARRTLAGRYELVEVIGRGGMGTVHRAVDLVLRRTVAVKLLAGPAADRDASEIARFEREARAAAALSHPAVVAVYDTGEDRGTRFIVMEYVPGRSLEAVLHAEGRLEPDRASAIAVSVAGALAAAHAAGIVHRDIKPANVMLADDGSVKVLDFGIARSLDGTTLTRTDTVLGTAAYMSPEQALGHRADERSDIYSLGCVLYALLAGHPPFTGGGIAAIVHQHATLAPPPLRPQNPLVSRALELLVMEMLAKSPDERPQRAATVRDQLNGQSSQAPVLPADTAPTRVQRRGTRTPVRSRDSGPVRRRAVVAAPAGVLAAAVAVVALAASSGSPGTRPGAKHRSHVARSGTKDTQSHSAATGRPRTTATSATGISSTRTGTSTTTRSSTASSGTAAPLTVPGGAGALTALVTADAQSGTIDQQAAQQIANDLNDVLNAYEMDNTTNVQHMLAQFSQQVAMLEQHGDITSAATAALTGAITNLATALARAPAATHTMPGVAGQPSAPGAQAGQRHGHGGQPPGQAKHHGHDD